MLLLWHTLQPVLNRHSDSKTLSGNHRANRDRLSAYSPDVPGCVAAGDTLDETRCNFQDALAAHFEAMREVGEPIPDPRSAVDYVEVAA